MGRSVCALLIIAVVVWMGDLGEAKPRKNQPNMPPPAEVQPDSDAICGQQTSPEMMTKMAAAVEKATEYVLEQRNYAWGWTPEPFADIASAILSLQMSSDGGWYGKVTDDLTAQLSVKQLEIEFLAHMTQLLTAEKMKDMDRDHMEPGYNDTYGNDGMPMKPGGLEETTGEPIDNGGMDPGMGHEGRPDGEGPGPSGHGDKDEDMMNGMMRMMSIDTLANHVIALALTCHPIDDFFGHDLWELLEYRLHDICYADRPEGDGMPGGPDGDMGMPGGPDGDMGMPGGPDGDMGMPTGPDGDMGMPGGPDGDMGMPTGPDGDMGRPGGPDGDMGRPGGPDGDYGMMMECAAAKGFHLGLGLLIKCQSGEEFRPEMIGMIMEAYTEDVLMEAGAGGSPILLLALSCIKDQVPEELKRDYDNAKTRVAMYLMDFQKDDGSFENPVVTSFAVQALRASGSAPSKWNCKKAVNYLLDSQNKESGAFLDSLGATLAIMPTIAHKTLADLKDVMPDCEIPNY